MPKIVIIGAGSGFGGRLSMDIMATECLRDACIGLCDIHPGRLGQVSDYVRHTAERHAVLTHDALVAIVDIAKKSSGSLRDAFLAHAGTYGIDDIDFLFPDAQNVSGKPAFIKRPTEWVSDAFGAAHKSPFSRIKTVAANITADEARAKGYVKGNEKVDEVIALLKRITTPTTVYKKQKLDRDDIVDITDFDVVAWLKYEMRGMLDEELARAILVSDGRSPASDDKINESNIRPI